MPFPDIDPVLFSVGPLAVRWYSLAYIAGLVLGWWYVGWLDKTSLVARRSSLVKLPANRARRTTSDEPLFSKRAWDDLLLPAVVGIVLGGRLGYVLFYNLPYYLDHPLEALMVWQGGMSFHGGLLGVLIAYAWYARARALPYLAVMDLLACATPIGLFFGRVANFINGELFGRVTDAPWGIVFPRGGELPRHPSQLYEAGLEGAALFLLLLLLARFTRALEKTGFLSGAFLVGYALARTCIEHFREPDAQIGFLFAQVTMGQLLSLPMLLVGIWLMVRARYVSLPACGGR